jgi:1-acyl-sn-glycerol-3-phosphate acyltransferase
MGHRTGRHYRRLAIRGIGRALQALFTRTTVTGREYVPPHGPYIAVGNHVAVMEVALMVTTLPHVVEVIGNGDVPLDPAVGWLARWYGFIPIRRGQVDRQALKAALGVLEAGQVLGTFPEGGIWDHTGGTARPGVAWLSQQTGAPILPMGFGGVLGALGQAMRLKRPRLSVAIGPLLPPVPNSPSLRARKEAIEQASEQMMQSIRALVPDGPADHSIPQEDRYAFRVELTGPDGSAVALPVELAIPCGEDLAYYFHRPVLLEVIYRNYRIAGAKPLASFPTLTDPARLGAALDVALGFYEREPAFLGYRLGYARTGRVLAGLRALRQAMAWAAVQNCQMHVIPERTIMKSEEEIETVSAPSIRREF